MVRRFVFRWFRRLLFAGILLLLLTTVAFAVLFRSAIHNRFVRYPEVEAAWEELRAQRQTVQLEDGWEAFRGICHTHSHLSHDSTVPFEDILAAAKEARLDFVMLTDHCQDGKIGDFSLQWSGLHDGVFFVPGFETSNGFLVWGLPPDRLLECNLEPAELAGHIAEHGGVCVFTHTEAPRRYELQEVSGMEIYNIHTDILDENYLLMLGETLVNSRRFPDLTLYSIFDRQTQIWTRWDEMNSSRPFAGISANDAHQNVGLALHNAGDRINVNSTSGDPLASLPIGPLSRFLPNTASEMWRLNLDPYARSLRFVNMHVLARELSQEELLEAVSSGRSYIGFDIIADTAGFTYLASSAAGTAVMGETVVLAPGLELQAESPLPCRFRLLRGGQTVSESQGRHLEYVTDAPGNYRLEVELQVLEDWVPWIITNPIRVIGAAAENH